jgi:endonuclease YncB( thermonuclease family)
MGLCTSLHEVDYKAADTVPAPKDKFEAFVVSVYDGDTITIVYKYRGKPFCSKIRLNGINAPEIKTKDQEEKKNGLESKDYLAKLILNKYVYIHVCGPDKYYRLDADVYLNKKAKTSVNQAMIDQGYAVTYMVK